MRLVVLVVALLLAPSHGAAQEEKHLPSADERYKADILLVVAHPDDEGAATPYLARALDEGKRVAVAFGTRGSSGANEAGGEQASALGAIREIEARRALGLLGITNVWFLGGKDTASQNVLQSLANWEHGAALEHLVRLVRLTRPEVVLTFLPGTFIGEDHGDHQAAGVLATEAFDLAGDPSVFPEQLAAPMRRLEPFLENLRPWQCKKIYYFPDASNDDMFRGKGPEYPVKDISKASKQAYWRIAMESFRAHQTQAKGYLDSLAKLSEADLEKKAISDGWGDVQRFVLGKSLVGGSVTGGIFENVTPGAIGFVRPAALAKSELPDVAITLAGPWQFYEDFRREHGLTLWHPEPPEIALQAGTSLVIPLWLRNETGTAREISIVADLPAGWKLTSGAGKFVVGPKQVAAGRVEIDLPAIDDAAHGKQEAREVTVRGESNGQGIGVVKVRVELRARALPE